MCPWVQGLVLVRKRAGQAPISLLSIHSQVSEAVPEAGSAMLGNALGKANAHTLPMPLPFRDVSLREEWSREFCAFIRVIAPSCVSLFLKCPREPYVTPHMPLPLRGVPPPALVVPGDTMGCEGIWFFPHFIGFTPWFLCMAISPLSPWGRLAGGGW